MQDQNQRQEQEGLSGTCRRVTVVTVVYNGVATVEEACRSVMAQRAGLADLGVDLEYIVVDGGSRDGTVELLQVLAAQPGGIDRWVSEPDGGLYDAMNKGLAWATGDFVGFLNSDDVYAHGGVLAGAVARVLAGGAGGAGRGVDAWYGDLAYVDGEGRVVRRWRSGGYRRGAFLQGWMPPHPTFFVRRERVAELGGGFRLVLRSAADYEFMLRMLHVGGLDVVYHPETMVHMRVGGMSNASWRHRLRAHREDWRAWSLNGLRPYPWTLPMKPLRKVTQFF
jgi:glycosyltransferase involved in cell wall biosynthesis